MRFSVNVPGPTLYGQPAGGWAERLSGREILDIAQRADELGFDVLHVSEHIVMHTDDVAAMGPRWSHTLSTMSAFAAATRRIEIAGLIVVPYHHPVELAKALATIDFLSGGRVRLIAAVGYMEWEFDVLGVPYARRGAIMDEYLDAIVELWTSEEPSFDGEFVRFDDVVFEPKPIQTPRPPIWFAGHSKAALRRLARHGDGWITYDTARTELGGMLEYLHAQPGLAARRRPLEIGMPLFEEADASTHALRPRGDAPPDADTVLEQVEALAGLGVTLTRADMALGSGGFRRSADVDSLGAYLERLEWFAADVLPRARA